jgi:hypothetical protein
MDDMAWRLAGVASLVRLPLIPLFWSSWSCSLSELRRIVTSVEDIDAVGIILSLDLLSNYHHSDSFPWAFHHIQWRGQLGLFQMRWVMSVWCEVRIHINLARFAFPNYGSEVPGCTHHLLLWVFSQVISLQIAERLLVSVHGMIPPWSS